ncbi:glyoxalase superfamily protein [Paenibacillus sp. MMS18-CY102]|uniref:glyoxalase superfamily protein n=1 Tax=Paenibacillus sp. MMS18-CY102 TaxID=2682849 RepID=UPI0013663159|nr:glyoxalase superfamily protein [Paenibacillus sp. MMS18-CY102]MWC29284.1 VOC family protein [Paenibacillus sp. MMS18-CY102]
MTYTIARTTPILRIFDETKAKEFYIGFLGFQLDWEHRYEPDLPLYMQVSSGECQLHLSEHFGDGTPGTAIRVGVLNIEELHHKLIGQMYKHARPGFDPKERAITLNDPFGNIIRFYELE